MSEETPRKRTAIVAAARQIKLDDAKAAKSAISKRQSWQEEAWAYFDEVPEVKFGCLYLGNGMSKVRFYAAVELEDGTHVAVDHESSQLRESRIAAQAVIEMSRLRSPLGGQGELNKQAAINWAVAGEFYVHGVEARPEQGIRGEKDYKPAEPERWDVRSVSEVELTNDVDALGRPVVKIKTSPDAEGVKIDNDSETLIRMWVRHARWSDHADCHMRALIGDCEALVLFANQQKAEAKSRQAAGALLIPAELGLTDDVEGAGDDADQGSSQFLQTLLQALTDPIEDPTSAASVMPVMISGPAEYLKPDVLRVLSFGRDSDSTLDQRIDQKINRLARGLNVPVEVVMGHMSTTFANAEQIDKDVFSDHFEPLCEALADAYASGFLIPQLLDAGFAVDEVEQVCVWFDASALVRGEPVEESADALYANGVISAEAYRRMKGANDEDAPDDVERLISLAERKGTLSAELTLLLLQKAGVIEPEARMQAPAEGDTDTENVDPAQAAAIIRALVADGADRTPIGRKLFEIDRELRTRLHAAAEAAMARALERAGNRLRSKSSALNATLRRTPSYRCVATAGPALVASAGLSDDDLLAGAWDEFEQQYKEWSLLAVDATIAALADEIALTEDDVELMRSKYQLDIDESWLWLAAAMTEQAKSALYSPERGAVTAAASDRGEFDASSRVPVGIVREATQRAGGATNVSGAPGEITAPAGGLATGATATSTLADSGLTVEAYRWVYGPASRSEFPPHKALDGVIFANFDDPVLTRRGDWPKTSHYYPGDHKGCVCDFEPVIVDADEIGRVSMTDRMRADAQWRDYVEEQRRLGNKVDGNKRDEFLDALTKPKSKPKAKRQSTKLYEFDASNWRNPSDVAARAVSSTKAPVGHPVLVRDLNFSQAGESVTIRYAAAVKTENGRHLLMQLPNAMDTKTMRQFIDDHPGTFMLRRFDSELSAKGQKVAKQVAFFTDRNPADAYWSRQYGTPFTSAATADMRSGAIQFWIGESNIATMRHEFGHLLDDALSKYDELSSSNAWGKAASTDFDVVKRWRSQNAHTRLSSPSSHPLVLDDDPMPSGYSWKYGVTRYGRANEKEDFAESVSMFLADRVGHEFAPGLRFADLYPNRHELLRNVLKGYLHED